MNRLKRPGRSTLFWGALAAGVLTVALLVGTRLFGGAEAGHLPGTVEQSAAAMDAGVTVSVEKAVFSGTATDVRLQVTFDDPSISPAGIDPTDATLGGAAGESAVDSADGHVVIRFPASRLDPAGGSSTLSIGAVQILEDGPGITRISGSWNLDVQLPSGDEANEASRVEALKPAVMTALGQDVLVEGYRTSAATVVRYTLPAALSEAHPPTLFSGGKALRADRAKAVEAGGATEAWFDTTPFGSPVNVVFDGLLGAVTNQPSSGFRLAVAPHDVPDFTSLDDMPQRQVLEWSLTSAEAGAPSVVDVSWMREEVDRVSIRVTVDGTWKPSTGSKPRVTSSGVDLFVSGVINYDASGTRGAQTVVVADLPDGRVPSDLTVDIMGASFSLASAEVTLEP